MTEYKREIIPIHGEASEESPLSSPTEDIVEIPPDRRHDSGTAASVSGVLLALVVAIVGGAVLGAGYGAVIALCGKKYINICLACSFPFWMNIPAQLGFMWGHLQERKWRRRIGSIGFVTCLYAVCVGWLFAVLDGPGLVLNPFQLIGHLADVSIHGLWATSLRQEFTPLAPYLLTLRFGSLSWLLVGGLMSGGGVTPFPYCQKCKRWMEDEVSLCLRYDPPSTQDARLLAADLVAGRYESLLALDEPIDPKKKGLKVSVFSCEGCGSRYVLDATWYRQTPDGDKNDTEQLLESGTGTKLVSGLIVPAEVQSYVSRLEKAKAA